jgi:branched-chain amino acid transport system permease protein
LHQGSAAHWALRTAGGLLIAYVALSPLFRDLKPSEYGELTDILVLALAAMSLNLLIGFTGQISIGHSAFFGVGSYTLAVLVADHGWSPGWTYPVAALLCFAVGVLVGIPALRLKGPYLSLVTLALAQIFPALVRKFDHLTNGSAGIDGLRYDTPEWTGFEPGRSGRVEWLYFVALVTLALGYLLVRNLVKSRVGRAMVAVRDHSTAAAAMGVNVSFTKTIVFGLSGAMAGIAGCTFALRQTQVTPENVNYTIIGAFLFLVIMIIGGRASLLGPIVGAYAYHRIDEFARELPGQSWLPESFTEFLTGRPNLATLVFAALLIVLMFVAPFGLAGFGQRVGQRVVQVVPKPPKRSSTFASTVADGEARRRDDTEDDGVAGSPADVALT